MKNRLRILRAEREWSQGELARRVGVSRQTIHAIESGKSDPALSLGFSLARIFGRRVDEVFQPDEPQAPYAQ